MYLALWKALPGPRWARVVILASAAIIVIALLMMFVFPAVDTFISRTDSAVS